jgi:Tol biopolymer transport system component
MELIDGAPLKGPLPLETTLDHARQIADALEAAHERGIIHRDLKPANILITSGGVVKVLDFGLAKNAEAPASSPENSPTLTTSPTRAGMILGTAAYMAPEQARGKVVDKRADIWAFGVVLYEILTGEQLFHGETVSDILAAVLKSEPDLTRVPPQFRRLLERCLEKDPKKRLRDIGDAMPLIETPREAASSIAAPPSRPGWLWPTVASVLLLTTGALGFLHFRETPTQAPVVRTTILSPENAAINTTYAAVSPDGQRIVFSARNSDGKTQLWIRPLDSLTAQPLAGTDGAGYSFWSPDGKSIGFFANRKLNRIDASGGPVLALADAMENLNVRGAAWSSSGAIVFHASGPLRKISASGGAASDATKFAPGESSHRWPSFLPDGVHFLFLAGVGNSTARKTVRLGSLNSLDSTPLMEADSGVIFSAGHLLFLRGQTLMAQSFDAHRLALTEEVLPVVEDISMGPVTNGAAFSASPGGLLVYGSGRSESELTWWDRQGNPLGALGEPGRFNSLNFSANRKSLAIAQTDEGRNINIWLLDVERGVRERLTSEGTDADGILSADAATVFFSSHRKDRLEIYSKPANRSGPEQLVFSDENNNKAESVSPDGKFLLFRGKGGLWVLPDPLGPPGAKPIAVPRTSAQASYGQFSPDGRWIAYQSNESGRPEIYVVAFPGPGGRQRISTAGGTLPRWRPDGKEIFYLAPSEALTAAEVSVKNGSLEVGAAHELFRLRLSNAPGWHYDVSADGRRILTIATIAARRNVAPSLTVVQNWTAGLKK